MAARANPRRGEQYQMQKKDCFKTLNGPVLNGMKVGLSSSSSSFDTG